MVTVQILDQRHHIHAQSKDQRPNLLGLPRLSQEIHHLLDCPRSVHVQRDANQVVGNGVNDRRPLLLGRVLEKLLAEVVAKGISHEFGEVAIGFVEDHVTVFGVAVFEFLLEVATTVLVLTERKKLALEIFNANACESVELAILISTLVL